MARPEAGYWGTLAVRTETHHVCRNCGGDLFSYENSIDCATDQVTKVLCCMGCGSLDKPKEHFRAADGRVFNTGIPRRMDRLRSALNHSRRESQFKPHDEDHWSRLRKEWLYEFNRMVRGN